ncbi:methyltransferase domain-containing protein [Ktedonosporobacter rubrisoli]|uniref:Methyltransferase domain-containing protein n=1 Tax=Ktedonosporobacter rubrisoli TaxID=2509675 RepID=A0A4P6JRS2_KTERU|nr:methyltransferase domain-containing protein [Ktedonosporobacter rubrisoli]QBD77526.1 methyltransferase domain-containing protein [Ktedonosporobacter rubrisoli]
MHTFTHTPSSEAQAGKTQGHVINWGWRYDLMLWWHNLTVHGKWQELQYMIAGLAQFQPGESVLDVGCGTGKLALIARRLVGPTGRVHGIDPGPKQIARARSKARRTGLSINFQIGVIERMAFPDQSFDIGLSTFMMHVLPNNLKHEGLAEIARVLKPGGRLLIVDTKRPVESAERSDRPIHVGPWNSGIQDLPQLLREAGFTQIESGDIEMGEKKFPELGFVKAHLG